MKTRGDEDTFDQLEMFTLDHLVQRTVWLVKWRLAIDVKKMANWI
jgi:hypothetical protein